MTDSLHGIYYQKDADGIVTVTMDMAGTVNKMDDHFREAIVWLGDRLEAEEGLTGVVLSSAKPTFFAGGDIDQMKEAQSGDEPYWIDFTETLKRQMRRLEKLPVPVVAAINGAALGGGLELCLSCNYRIAWNSPLVVVGLPEVTLGILPGGGGLVHSIHMLGLEKALPLLLEGKRLRANEAHELGWIDTTVNSVEELLPTAKAWIKANPGASTQPWDIKGYRLPHGDLGIPENRRILDAFTSKYLAKTRGLLPAPMKILSVARDVLAVDFDTALNVETRGSVELMMNPVSKNLMASNFVQWGQVKNGCGRPNNTEGKKVERVGIVGTDPVGEAVARICTRAGISVVMLEGASENAGEFRSCDLVIEALPEDPCLKSASIRRSESRLMPGGIWATSSAGHPIKRLAQAAAKPENLIGIHFLSRNNEIVLVEIIRDEKTSQETIATSYDFVRQTGKIPIVVNDSPGFYTTRVLCTYLDEGARLLEEGLDPLFIEETGKAVGMDNGPLAEFDQFGQRLLCQIDRSDEWADSWGSGFDIGSALRIADKLVNGFNRGGRFAGGGFFEYNAQGIGDIWSGLHALYHVGDAAIDEQDAKDRLLFRQSIEALKCLQEGILNSVAEGNIGSLLGIGAPTWTGGLIQFVNGYGHLPFLERCYDLARHYGERFSPPPVIAERLGSGELFE